MKKINFFKNVGFLQIKRILSAQQVHRFLLEFHAGKKNHVIKVAVVVLHCEWSSDSLLKLIFSSIVKLLFISLLTEDHYLPLTPSSKEVKHWAITNCFIRNSFGLFSQPSH